MKLVWPLNFTQPRYSRSLGGCPKAPNAPHDGSSLIKVRFTAEFAAPREVLMQRDLQVMSRGIPSAKNRENASKFQSFTQPLSRPGMR